MHRLSHAIAVACALLVCGAGRIVAQVPDGARGLSPTAIADSLSALVDIDAHLRGAPRDATAWHRRGMIAWALAIRDQVPPPVRGIEWQRYARAADTSLRIAAYLAPDSVQYAVAAARYLSSFFGPLNRTAASLAHAKAHEDALARRDARQIVASGRSGGRLEWRLHESGATMSVDRIGAVSPLMRTAVAGRPVVAAPPPLFEKLAEDHALRAERYLRDAVHADPSDVDAARDLAMILSDGNRWSEVGAVGRALTDANPSAAWGWLLTGLAAQRRTDYPHAASALERGLALLDSATRERWDRLERILPVTDTAAFAALPPAERARRATRYWRDSDPLWSVAGDETRTEYLARLVQSELRFSIPDLGVQGLSTDRANVVVRWGPPASREAKEDTAVKLIWQWHSGQLVRFRGYEEMPFDPRYTESVESAIARHPVIWENIRVAHVDSLPSQAVRFRGDGVVNTLLAFRANAGTVARAASVRQPVFMYQWYLGDDGRIARRDSSELHSDSLIMQVLPLSNHVHHVRTEISAPDAPRAGRIVRTIDARQGVPTGLELRGFGMSDVLLATTISGSATTARRWSDVAATPLVGTASRATGITLLWENYEPSDSAGTAALDVIVQLSPLDRTVSLSAAVIARLRGLTGAAVERNDGSSEVQFTQRRPWAPVLVDQLQLDLSTVPDGRYALRVLVNDPIQRRQVQRVVVFTVGA